MGLIDRLSPKETEELRPGVFVQTINHRDGKTTYRTVNPIAWKNKWRLNKQFGIKNLITISIILFVAWSYFHDTEFCRDLQENPCDLLINITNYCYEKSLGGTEVLNDDWKNNFAIQDNIKEALG